MCIRDRQCTSKGEPTPKKANTILSAGKVTATVFLGRHSTVLDVIYSDYLKKWKQLIPCVLCKPTATCKQEQMATFREKKVLFHQDNASPHKLIAVMNKNKELKFDLLAHPAYSPPFSRE